MLKWLIKLTNVVCLFVFFFFKYTPYYQPTLEGTFWTNPYLIKQVFIYEGTYWKNREYFCRIGKAEYSLAYNRFNFLNYFLPHSIIFQLHFHIDYNINNGSSRLVRMKKEFGQTFILSQTSRDEYILIRSLGEPSDFRPHLLWKTSYKRTLDIARILMCPLLDFAACYTNTG